MTITTIVLLNLAVFAGALVSGLAGFAFSAVAGAVLLHMLPPIEAVPFMMVCSIIVQTVNLWSCREGIRPRNCFMLILGGALAMPLAIYCLQKLDISTFKTGFGVFIAAYAAFMMFRPTAAWLSAAGGNARGALIGFGGGFVGGLTAMPGAVPTIWCDLQGMPKDRQRAFVQPFIAAMQLLALVLMISGNTLSANLWSGLAFCLPGLLGGVAVGLLLFRRVNDRLFRRIVLGALFVSGLALIA